MQTKDYVQCPTYDTSYGLLHFSPIRGMCTSACPVTLLWLLDGNGHLPPPTHLQPGRREWSWSLPTFVPIGPTILHSIQRGCCYVACLSSMRTAPNTCLLVSTLLASIYHLLSLELSGRAVDLKHSFSVMNKWTHWRRPCPHYGTCVMAKRLLGVAGATVVPSGRICHAVGVRLVCTSIHSSFL